MHNLSLVQALDVWTCLEAAYHLDHRYGGDTAEIYMSRVTPYDPSANFVDENREKRTRTAMQSLFALLRHFEEERSVIIKINGRRLGPWWLKELESHRVHVQVIRKKT